MLTELSALLDLLKAKGVTHARLEPWSYPPGKELAGCGVIDVTFGAVPSEQPDTKTPSSVEPREPDLCACGHGLHEHQSGLCLHACEPEKCSKEGA